MELVLSTENLESLPEPVGFSQHLKPEGILNSNYKSIVNKSLKNSTSQSIFGIRQRLKRGQYRFTSSIETVLKVLTFVILIISIFS